MTFIKDDSYKMIKENLFEYFKNNFKTEKDSSYPSQYDYNLKDIPNSFFSAIDVYSKAKQFLRRYLIVVVQNGDTTKISPDGYSEYLDLLCDLPNPTGNTYNQGIALIVTDNQMKCSEFVLQKELRQVNCGS